MRSEVLLLLLAVSLAPWSERPKFYPDDPLRADPELEDASGVRARDVAEGYDFVATSLLKLGDATPSRAWNVNTLDEVPDSSWFVNRIGTGEMSLDEIRRGPDKGGPRPGPWQIQSSKTRGITPGFTMRDVTDQLFFVKFDPPGNLEMASAAEVIATKILYAAGYHVPENYIASFEREDLRIEGATYSDRAGQKRRMVEEDVDRLLEKVARSPDGTYRVMASKALPGRPIGSFRYYGTRTDDPNDVFPHEHRRELRGLKVLAAWINNADSRGLNSLDTLVSQNGRSLVRHHLLDFGSTLGSAAISVKSRRSGNEYLWNINESFLQMITFGFRVPDWTRVPFPEIPSIGRFESGFFTPDRWRPHYRNPAFENAQPEDLFWGARLVMAFSDEIIRAIVAEGQLSDRFAEEYLCGMLMERRDKIGRAWLTIVNPLVDFELSHSAELSFRNAAVDAGLVSEPEDYEVSWFALDNTTRDTSPLASADAAPRTQKYVKAEIRTVHCEYPHWYEPVHVYFRRAPTGWETVGIER